MIISGSLLSPIFYNSGDQEIKQLFNPPFSINDTNCDPFVFAYVTTTNALKISDKSIITRILDFPMVVNGATTFDDYFSLLTTKYNDSPYIFNVSIMAIFPD